MRTTAKGRNISVIAALLAAGLVLAGTAGAAEKAEISDTDITHAVENELLLARGVSLNDVDVETTLGVVTLSGTVDNILAKDRSERIASMVKGVRSIVNNIQVAPDLRPDREIQEDVENALVSDPATESWEVAVGVQNGKVTLSGDVDSWQEKQLAARVAKGVRGVRSVENELTITYDEPRTDYEIKKEIESALMWDVRLNDAFVDVEVDDGEVKLSGSVGSVQERSLAVADAWVPGVHSVQADELKVEWWARDEMLRKERFTTKSDEEVAEAIRDAFLLDPRVTQFHPEVEVKNGVVTLRGVVDNLKAKRAAAQDAANTAGVWRVKNHLKVRPVADREDAEIARDIRSDFLADPYVNTFDIDVKVDDGVARLTGSVDSYFDKWQAEDIAVKVPGVVKVDNLLHVDYEPLDYETTFYDWDVVGSDYDVDTTASRRPGDWEIRQDIKDEMFWSPYVDANQVNVAVDEGIATLTGTVDSWSERAQATEEALEGGAMRVKNQLEVVWGPDIPIL